MDEISGSVEGICRGFSEAYENRWCPPDTMGYCMDTVLALVDPCQTGRMDIDLFVEEVVAPSIAWALVVHRMEA